MADADHEFHVALCELTGNSWLIRLYAQIADQSRLMQALDVLADDALDGKDFRLLHDPIVDAIGSGSPEAAQDAVLTHIDLSEQLFLGRVRLNA
jgi:DNA-binding GntR family transcriptional regulator